MKVGIAGTNPADAMLTHQHRNVQVMKHVSSYIRHFC